MPTVPPPPPAYLLAGSGGESPLDSVLLSSPSRRLERCTPRGECFVFVLLHTVRVGHAVQVHKPRVGPPRQLVLRRAAEQISHSQSLLLTL